MTRASRPRPGETVPVEPHPPAAPGTTHQVIYVDTTTNPWRTGPAQRYGYCTRWGCRFRWDGIGSFDHAKTEHEQLNET